MNAPLTDPTAFSLTEAAARRIAVLMRQEQDDVKLRVAVNGGGCSGFQYAFDFDAQVNEDDTIIERDGAVVLVDSMSMEFLQGAELDFAEDLMASAFRINNPNAASSCGCGTSFSV